MNLEQFASRGMKAQIAVDAATAAAIAASTDLDWLKRVVASDLPLSLRIAAQKRVRKLQKERLRR
jgi:uncharacterized protein YhjY with autotransporter beta-barrel domain